ncbi:MAG: hypothetical protein MJ212_02520, partial [Alphaproteobacteria bacterium]|nr:hypothetical protein [Alphaproteobacteria bacterium]
KRASQFGRSMIEMLGVLAIIGVLSVGGIAGYTEAMRKYKMNKTIEIVRAFLFRLMEIDQMKPGGVTEKISYDVDQYVATGLLPEEICDKNYVDPWGNTGLSCQLPVGGIDIDIEFGSGFPLRGQYTIIFTDGDKERNCVDFLSYHWEKITPKDWWNTTVGEMPGGYIGVFGGAETTVYAGKQENGPTELTMDNIAKACHKACKGYPYCYFYMVFRQEL